MSTVVYSDIARTSASNTFTEDQYISDGDGLIVGHTAAVALAPLAATEVQVLGTDSADSSATFGRWSANAFCGQVNIVKSRNAAIGSFTIVQDNDEVAALAAFPDDGVDYGTEAARYVMEVDDASPAAGDVGMAHVWYSMAGGGAAIAEKMRLSAMGVLGVGGIKMSGAINGKQGTDIASATNISIPFDGNIFELTGTTKVDLISITNWSDGFEITLIANESVTIDHGTATSGSNVTILLAGAVDFAMTANDTLTLVLSSTTAVGQAWREKCRTVI